MIKILIWNKLIFLNIIIVLIQFSFAQKGHSVEPEEFLQDPQQCSYEIQQNYFGKELQNLLLKLSQMALISLGV